MMIIAKKTVYFVEFQLLTHICLYYPHVIIFPIKVERTEFLF